jgi:hypothetical protein
MLKKRKDELNYHHWTQGGEVEYKHESDNGSLLWLISTYGIADLFVN